ncbi:hypothetical protein E4T42_08737 [Aureobasidium subglaciale]|nr:hypothetical protein E4T42_08737 [Aureobasidium subglaciale]
MNDYGLVSSEPPWKWVVDKPCFVSWASKEEGPMCLGQLSPLNASSRLTIKIGWRPNTDELLIALHLPISIRASKHPRDMFMIIPCDFDASVVDTSFTPVQADGRADLESAGLADCNLFHIPFSLTKSCEVIMPRAKRLKPVKGTPKELMSKFKILSETLSFDIHFRFDTFAQLELQRIFASVSQLNTPTLLLDGMYDGRGGGVNLWVNQGLFSESSEIPDNEQCLSIADPLQQEFPPPPYTSDTIPSLDLNKPHVEVPFSDANVASMSIHKDSDVEGVSETPFWTRMRRIMDYRSPSLEPPRRDTSKRAASVDSLPDGAAYRKKQICLFRSPRLEPALFELSATLARSKDSLIFPIDGMLSAPPASNRTNDKIEEIARWLCNAWEILPTAHLDLRTQLLALGTAGDANEFAKARVECSTQLAFAAARTAKQEHPRTLHFLSMSDAEQQVREVVEWVNSVKPDADLVLMRDLVALAEAALSVVDFEMDSESGKMKNLVMCKAKCIASACLL